MKFIKTQKGYALLLVMLLVVLFTILGMGLLTMNMNASKQFNLKEEQVQARHLAEMGLLHYQSVLEKSVSANKTDLKCSRIELLLPNVNMDSKNNLKYEIKGDNVSGVSCTEKTGSMEIKVTSESKGGLGTKKIVAATYFIKNIGSIISGTGTTPPLTLIVPAKPVTTGDKITVWDKNCEDNGKNKCKDINETITKFTEVNTITMKQNGLHFLDNLVVNKLVVNGGNGATLKVDKNMYVNDEIDVQNHLCVAVGQNLVVKNALSSKNKLYMVIYKDAYLPKKLVGTSSNNDMYVFGNIFLSSDFQMPESTNKVMNIYVQGNVYTVAANNVITKITNPFESMSGNRAGIANNLSCAIPGMGQPTNPTTPTTPTTPSQALWKLEDDPLINYK